MDSEVGALFDTASMPQQLARCQEHFREREIGVSRPLSTYVDHGAAGPPGLRRLFVAQSRTERRA